MSVASGLDVYSCSKRLPPVAPPSSYRHFLPPKPSEYFQNCCTFSNFESTILNKKRKLLPM